MKAGRGVTPQLDVGWALKRSCLPQKGDATPRVWVGIGSAELLRTTRPWGPRGGAPGAFQERNRIMYSDSQSDINKTDVDQLNSFLRGELAAVETYDQALRKIGDARIQEPLREVRASHDRRADLLRQRIAMLGGQPASNSGMWGGFAKLVQGSATLLGVTSAVAALEEGEDLGREDYDADLGDLSAATQSFVSTTILPEQVHTHDVVSALQETLKARSDN
jgi:uncharacterized protein (TIGR02284 family)